MKCPNPKCRKEIALEATRCERCGWSVTSGGVNAARDPEPPPASPEVVQEHLAKIRSIVRPLHPLPDRLVNRAVAQAPLLTDVGHGHSCTCSECYAIRMPRTAEVPRPDEKIKAPPVKPEPSRLEKLRALFPVDA